jgi:hypothetical protein
VGAAISAKYGWAVSSDILAEVASLHLGHAAFEGLFVYLFVCSFVFCLEPSGLLALVTMRSAL